MENLSPTDTLRAAAEFVVVLDQHPLGAGIFLILALLVVWMWSKKP